MAKIATQQEVRNVGGKGTVNDPDQGCTKSKAEDLGCKVTGSFTNNQCITAGSYSKNSETIYLWLTTVNGTSAWQSVDSYSLTYSDGDVTYTESLTGTNKGRLYTIPWTGNGFITITSSKSSFPNYAQTGNVVSSLNPNTQNDYGLGDPTYTTVYPSGITVEHRTNEDIGNFLIWQPATSTTYTTMEYMVSVPIYTVEGTLVSLGITYKFNR